MDPVCHTLVGTALAQSGIRRTLSPRLATTTMIVAANLPDVDVITTAWGGAASFYLRRGITHGLAATLVLPAVWALVVWGYLTLRGRRPTVEVLRWLAAISFLGVLTHPVLDFMNVYGMRWLMPFSDRWFYGDVLFIVDPVMWLLLGWGVAVSSKTKDEPARTRRARTGLAATAAYVALMAILAVFVKSDVSRTLDGEGVAHRSLMVAPEPINIFKRWVVFASDTVYRVGEYRMWDDPRLDLYELEIPANVPSVLEERLERRVDAQRFLYWARFPYYQWVGEAATASPVHIGDARYTIDPEDSWAALTVYPDPAEP